MKRHASISAAVGFGALFAAAAAWAHSFPKSEIPAAGSTVEAPPATVAIHFDNPVEAMFARLQAFDAHGTDVSAGAASLAPNGLDLSVPLKLLAPGDYKVSWSVTGRDSHSTKGSFAFTVAGKAPR
jgi:hypothetical protein